MTAILNDVKGVFENIDNTSEQYIGNIVELTVESMKDIRFILDYKYQVFINILFLFIIFGVY